MTTAKRFTAAIFVLVVILVVLLVYRIANAEPDANHLIVDAQRCTAIGLRFRYTDTGITPIITGDIDDIGQVLITCPFSPWSYQATEVEVIDWGPPTWSTPGEVFYIFKVPNAGYDPKYYQCTVYAGIRYLPYGSTTPVTEFLEENPGYNCPNYKLPFMIKDVWGMRQQQYPYPEPQSLSAPLKEKMPKGKPYP